jgi:hypothetical protein
VTLPPRKTKAKKDKRWRSPAHLNFVRSFHCANCDAEAPIEAAHVRLGGHGGMGFKPADWRCVPLCRDCHSWQHNVGERTFWQEYEAQAGQTVEELIGALILASPKRFDILKAQEQARAA